MLMCFDARAYNMAVTNIQITSDNEGNYGYSYDWSVEGGWDAGITSIACPGSVNDQCLARILPTLNGYSPYSGTSTLWGVGTIILKEQTWNHVYKSWIDLRGRSGHYATPPSPNIGQWPWSGQTPRWQGLCFAFVTSRQASPWRLAPGSSCYPATPPGTNCKIVMPSEIDLGVVTAGDTASSVGYGHISCNRSVSVRAQLLNSPTLDGLPVQITVNGRVMGRAETNIGAGSSLPLSVGASVDFPLMHAGVYYTDSVISFTYD